MRNLDFCSFSTIMILEHQILVVVISDTNGGLMMARIGELLVENDFIVEEQVIEALEIQRQRGCQKKLGEILIELGYIDATQLSQMLSEQAAIRTWYRFGR